MAFSAFEDSMMSKTDITVYGANSQGTTAQAYLYTCLQVVLSDLPDNEYLYNLLPFQR